MRYRSSSSLSYRNVLIAAGLAAALGVGTAYTRPGEAIAAQPHANGQTPKGAVDGSAGRDLKARAAAVPSAPADIRLRSLRR
jgi:hypothetical protein